MGTSLRVLIVEDSEEDTELLLEELRLGGYDPTFERVDTAAAVTAALARAEWDIVISDYTMPNFSPFAALKLLQESELDLPFIIVSGSIGEDAAVAAMKAGSHDYVMKDKLKRLIPGIERELREATMRREHKRSNVALKESEERLRMAINAAQMYTWHWFVQTGKVIWSGHHEEIYGMDSPAAEGTYTAFLNTIYPEDRKKVEQAVERALQAKVPYHVDFRILRSDGSFRWLEEQGQTHCDNTGRVVRMSGVTQDITERMIAERRRTAQYAVTQILAESSTLAQATPKIIQEVCLSLEWNLGGLWVVDKHVNLLRYLNGWHMLEFSVKEFEAVSLKTTFPPGVGLPGRVWASGGPVWIPDITKDTNFPRAVIAAREGLHGACAYPIWSEGEIIGIIEFFSEKILPPDDDLLQMMASIGSQIGQFNDRKKAEEALKGSEERLRMAINAARMYTWDWDIQTGQMIRSGHYQEAHGLNLLASDSDYPSFLRTVHLEDRKKVEQAADRALQGEAPYNIDFRILRPDGDIRWLGTQGEVARDGKGKAVRMIGVTQDITERKEAEERRIQRLKELERFHQLSIGRELRMVELKQQINDLSRQLGKAPPYHLHEIQKDEA